MKSGCCSDVHWVSNRMRIGLIGVVGRDETADPAADRLFEPRAARWHSVCEALMMGSIRKLTNDRLESANHPDGRLLSWMGRPPLVPRCRPSRRERKGRGMTRWTVSKRRARREVIRRIAMRLTTTANSLCPDLRRGCSKEGWEERSWLMYAVGSESGVCPCGARPVHESLRAMWSGGAISTPMCVYT